MNNMNHMKPIRQVKLANGAIKNIYAMQDVVRSKALSKTTSSWNEPIGFKTKVRATKLRQGSHAPKKAKVIY